MTLFTLLSLLRVRSTAPLWDVANGVEVVLVKTEPESVLVRLRGNKDLGRVLQGTPARKTAS